MIRCPRCDRLVVDVEHVHRCPGCGASLTMLAADDAALRATARRLWWEVRLTGKHARRAVTTAAIMGAILGGGAHLLGSLASLPGESGIAALCGGFLGGLVAFLRVGHLSGMVLFGVGMVLGTGLFNLFTWIQFLAAGAVIAYVARDRRQGM